jgi:hypothetical protein
MGERSATHHFDQAANISMSNAALTHPICPPSEKAVDVI